MQIITAYYGNECIPERSGGWREQGDSAGGSSFCGPIALHSRRNSFLRADLLGRTVCAGCAPPSSAAFGSLAWPVIVKTGSTPYGGESRPGTKRFMVRAILDTAAEGVVARSHPSLSLSLAGRAMRWRVKVHRLRHNSRNAPLNGLLLSAAGEEIG